MKTITEVCHLCNGTGEVFLETLVPCPKCDKNETKTEQKLECSGKGEFWFDCAGCKSNAKKCIEDPTQIWCCKCIRLEKYIEDLKNTGAVGCAITDFIFHRYYDHKIIPLQDKYADLRSRGKEGYDRQLRKGMYEEYQYGVLGRSGPIDPSEFKDMDKDLKAKLQKIKKATDKAIDL